MTIHRWIAPLTLAALVAGMTAAVAQGAFPAPLPNQTAAPATSPFPPVSGGQTANSPFPPVNGATGGAAFPSGGAAPIAGGGGGFAAPQQQQQQQQASPQAEACMKEFLPLRQDAEKKANLIKAASQRKAPPDEACKLIANFGQSEIKMISFIQGNSKKCGIPPEVAQQMKTGHANTEKMRATVCNAAAQRAAGGGAAPGPSLSEALGAASVPEASPTKKGGSTFDTLTGNVLSR